jgi:pimeloyl-ACP methyl ester carboxylesterase
MGVKKVAVWGSVNEFGKHWRNEEMKQLEESGVIYISNSRTGQLMPVYKQLYDTYFENIERLHIPTAVKRLRMPLLIIHGTNDTTVPVNAAVEMHSWMPDSQLFLIENGDHTLGGKHPWAAAELPLHMHKAANHTLQFFLC